MGIIPPQMTEFSAQAVQTFGNVAASAVDTLTAGITAAAETRGIAGVSDGFETFQTLGSPLAGTAGEQLSKSSEAASFPEPAQFMRSLQQGSPGDASGFGDVGFQDLLNNLMDTKFNLAANLSDASRTLFAGGGIVDSLRNPLTEMGVIAPPQSNPLTEIGVIAPPQNNPLTNAGVIAPPQNNPLTEVGVIAPPQSNLTESFQALQNLETTIKKHVQQSLDLQMSRMRNIRA